MATQQIKDILNTEVPKPSFVLSPSVPAPLPSEMPFGESGTGTGRSGKDNVARTLDPYSGKFEQVAEDTPRIYGSDQSLLVEATSRTNHVKNSADVSSWDTSGVDSVSSGLASIIEGENINAYELTGTSDSDKAVEECGVVEEATHHYSAIIEQSTADIVKLRAVNRSKNAGRGFLEYDFSLGSISNSGGGVDDTHSRILPFTGPNGGEVVRIGFSANVFGEGGDQLEIHYYPSVGGGDKSILHHAQVEVAPNSSSPILTQGSATTRAGDDYSIFSGGQPSWWNPNEGTFFVEIVPLYQNTNDDQRILNGEDLDHRYLYLDEDGDLRAFDGTNLVSAGSVSNFSVNKGAVSFDASDITVSLNGSSMKKESNGKFLNTASLNIGYNNQLLASISRLLYYPRALPESTLNILTS